MNKEKRVEIFATELGYIENEEVREFTENILSLIPDCFFSMPASLSGKNHPEFALGEGGLVRHTKATVGIAMELFRTRIYKIYGIAKDLIIASLILHDGMKAGLDCSYTLIDHPILMSNLIQDYAVENEIGNWYTIICENVISHMGRWGRDEYGIKTTPTPVTEFQKFTHICDYLASRRFISVDFEKFYKYNEEDK